MVLLTQPIAKVALSFSTPEFFAVVFFGLASVVTLSGASLVNSLISLCLGLIVAPWAWTASTARSASPSACPSCRTASSSCW
jgi:TctA family transporter